MLCSNQLFKKDTKVVRMERMSSGILVLSNKMFDVYQAVRCRSGPRAQELHETRGGHPGLLTLIV